jgi:hypothetical protein
LARYTGNATSRLIEAVRPNKKRHRVRAPLDAAHLHAKRNGTGRRGRPWRLLRVATQPTQRNGPGADCVPRPLVSELPAGGAWGQAKPAEVLALRYEVGPPLAAISLDLGRALCLGLRIADRFGQHLVQLSLGLLRFPLGWLPLGHAQYVGMQEGESKPSRLAHRGRCGSSAPLDTLDPRDIEKGRPLRAARLFFSRGRLAKSCPAFLAQNSIPAIFISSHCLHAHERMVLPPLGTMDNAC